MLSIFFFSFQLEQPGLWEGYSNFSFAQSSSFCLSCPSGFPAWVTFCTYSHTNCSHCISGKGGKKRKTTTKPPNHCHAGFFFFFYEHHRKCSSLSVKTAACIHVQHWLQGSKIVVCVALNKNSTLTGGSALSARQYMSAEQASKLLGAYHQNTRNRC